MSSTPARTHTSCLSSEPSDGHKSREKIPKRTGRPRSWRAYYSVITRLWAARAGVLQVNYPSAGSRQEFPMASWSGLVSSRAGGTPPPALWDVGCRVMTRGGGRGRKRDEPRPTQRSLRGDRARLCGGTLDEALLAPRQWRLCPGVQAFQPAGAGTERHVCPSKSAFNRLLAVALEPTWRVELEGRLRHVSRRDERTRKQSLSPQLDSQSSAPLRSSSARAATLACRCGRAG